MADRLARSVLLAPNAVTRAAAAATRDREQRWMLLQPREVRASYVRDVLNRDHPDLRQEMWMLRQPDAVRESYVRWVIEPRLRQSPSPTMSPRRSRRARSAPQGPAR